MTVTWISVYNELPEPCEFVLAASTKSGRSGIAKNVGGGLEWVWVLGFESDEPNLWAPLPMVHKEGGGTDEQQFPRPRHNNTATCDWRYGNFDLQCMSTLLREVRLCKR